jgi:hypothetical protein
MVPFWFQAWEGNDHANVNVPALEERPEYLKYEEACGALAGILTATSDGKVNGALVAVMVWALGEAIIKNKAISSIFPKEHIFTDDFMIPPLFFNLVQIHII